MKTENKNIHVESRSWKRSLLAASVVAASFGTPQVALAEEDWLTKDWEVGGYVRQYLSWNLENPTLIGPGPAFFDGEQKDDYRYDLSMARTVGKLNLFRDFGNWRVKVAGRISRESPTDYGKDLQEVTDAWAATGGGTALNIRKDVYNDEELREFWVQGDITDTTNLKIGRQQVVWGETDFFQLLDVVHGYEFRWRSFLEPENEEVRKPLNLVNLVQRVDSLEASIQLLYIPGELNDVDDRGNSYDVEGGRWANNPNKGISFAAAPGGSNVKYNRNHPDADLEDDSFGLRWNGLAGDWGYSVGWFHGPNPNPVASPNPATNNFNPALSSGAYEGVYEGGAGEAGEFVFPTIDIFGVTANNYFAGPDLVFSTEIAYIPEAPYNYGIDGGVPGITSGDACGFFPGFCGIKEKKLVRSMFRIDKQLDLQNYLGTSRPSFFTVQLFNNWITDFEKEEQLVNVAGFGGDTKEFSSIITAVLAANYASDQINPLLAVGSDLTYGGGFVIPAVEFVYGDHLRLRVEADIFWHETDQDRPLQGFNDTNLFGYFSGNDQLFARLTYQF